MDTRHNGCRFDATMRRKGDRPYLKVGALQTRRCIVLKLIKGGNKGRHAAKEVKPYEGKHRRTGFARLFGARDVADTGYVGVRRRDMVMGLAA